MLVLLALAIGAIVLLAAVKAAAVWFTLVPLGILVTGSTFPTFFSGTGRALRMVGPPRGVGCGFQPSAA
ncbi:hypothetical protein ACIRJM_47060, partial [Streptomyces sp. NPDC102405]